MLYLEQKQALELIQEKLDRAERRVARLSSAENSVYFLPPKPFTLCFWKSKDQTHYLNCVEGVRKEAELQMHKKNCEVIAHKALDFLLSAYNEVKQNPHAFLNKRDLEAELGKIYATNYFKIKETPDYLLIERV